MNFPFLAFLFTCRGHYSLYLRFPTSRMGILNLLATTVLVEYPPYSFSLGSTACRHILDSYASKFPWLWEGLGCGLFSAIPKPRLSVQYQADFWTPVTEVHHFPGLYCHGYCKRFYKPIILYSWIKQGR